MKQKTHYRQICLKPPDARKSYQDFKETETKDFNERPCMWKNIFKNLQDLKQKISVYVSVWKKLCHTSNGSTSKGQDRG